MSLVRIVNSLLHQIVDEKFFLKVPIQEIVKDVKKLYQILKDVFDQDDLFEYLESNLRQLGYNLRSFTETEIVFEKLFDFFKVELVLLPFSQSEERGETHGKVISIFIPLQKIKLEKSFVKDVLSIWFHELVHVFQIERLGYGKAVTFYAKGYLNPLEAEAYAVSLSILMLDNPKLKNIIDSLLKNPNLHLIKDFLENWRKLFPENYSSVLLGYLLNYVSCLIDKIVKHKSDQEECSEDFLNLVKSIIKKSLEYYKFIEGLLARYNIKM